MKRLRLNTLEAQWLREKAVDWAAHLHDWPVDAKDSGCGRRAMALARAAYEYARAEGELAWVEPSRHVRRTR